eukprot:gene13118-13248_t
MSATVSPPAEADNSTPTAAATDPDVRKRAAMGEQTKQRLRKKSINWRDNQEQGVPSRGLVRITDLSKPAAAAVCVAADLKGPKGLTRVVAVNPRYAGKALQAIRLAGLMLNNQFVWKGANGLEQPQQEDGASGKQANLGEQPATAAVAESGTAATAEATGGRVVMFQPVMSTEDKIAYSISNCIQRQGWAVVEVVGNDSTLLVAVKAFLKARGLLHNRAKQDAAFTVLDHRTEAVTVTHRQKSGAQLPEKADAPSEPSAEQTEQQQQQQQRATTDNVPEEQEEESRSIQSITFNLLHRTILAVRCTKNKPTDLIMDASEVAGSDQQQG